MRVIAFDLKDKLQSTFGHIGEIAKVEFPAPIYDFKFWMQFLEVPFQQPPYFSKEKLLPMPVTTFQPSPPFSRPPI
jgi:hypothetical protein